MKTTTTTREYDAEGRITRETVTEYETPSPSSQAVPAVTACTCWLPITTSPYCPIHGQGMHRPYTITCVTPKSDSYTINYGNRLYWWLAQPKRV